MVFVTTYRRIVVAKLVDTMLVGLFTGPVLYERTSDSHAQQCSVLQDVFREIGGVLAGAPHCAQERVKMSRSVNKR